MKGRRKWKCLRFTEKKWNGGGRKLVLETGKVARQADGVMVSMGGTTVLCTVVGAKKAKPGQDFFPLTVNYQENIMRLAAFPAGFSVVKVARLETETLVSRLIDRPIRPLLPEGYLCETQVIATVLSTIWKTIRISSR